MLSDAIALPCGVVLKNRLVKAAMSDELGDGVGGATDMQVALYRRWAEGGAALLIVGECQIGPDYPENCGNLVLQPPVAVDRLMRMTGAARAAGAEIWAQLGHAGALAPPVTGPPKGPSALRVGALEAEALSEAEIEALPEAFARAALAARRAGFSGVQVHAAHGFLLNQFLSPFFNRRTDRWGGDIENRSRLLRAVIERVRAAVGPAFPVAVRLNVEDGLEGGLELPDALSVVERLDGAGVDLLDLSGGVYFPGAPTASDRAGSGPYFLDAAREVRRRTSVPLASAGGFKRRADVDAALASGAVDCVGLARLLVLDPDLPIRWLAGGEEAPSFPRFKDPAEGAVTAWYTQRIRAIGDGAAAPAGEDAAAALAAVSVRREANASRWRRRFG